MIKNYYFYRFMIVLFFGFSFVKGKEENICSNSIYQIMLECWKEDAKE
jgi:hypothetical protein